MTGSAADKPGAPRPVPLPTPPVLFSNALGAPGSAPVPPPRAPAPQSVPFRPTAPPLPSAPTPAAPAVPAPVSVAHTKPRHRLIGLSFLLLVLAPVVAAAVYLWSFAADQYHSRVGFAVRLEEQNSALNILSGLTAISGSSSSDTDILFEFIQSQRLVDDMDKQLDLRAIWSKPVNDPVFVLPADASLEEMVDYWNEMVHLSRGKGAGLLEVEVRAFDPEDALRISMLLFDKSSEMINELSAIAREDAIRYAREDLDEALERLKSAREAVTRFRNINQLVNPEIDVQRQAGLLATLYNQQASTLIELDMLRDSTGEGDPRLTQANRRLEVIEKRIAAERSKLGFGSEQGSNAAYADLIGEYERLVVDREFAERTYITAMASYDGAKAESRRKSRYLAAYMQPTLAETAIYPKRLSTLVMIALFLFLIWSIAVLVYYSIRDRR